MPRKHGERAQDYGARRLGEALHGTRRPHSSFDRPGLFVRAETVGEAERMLEMQRRDDLDRLIHGPRRVELPVPCTCAYPGEPPYPHFTHRRRLPGDNKFGPGR